MTTVASVDAGPTDEWSECDSPAGQRSRIRESAGPRDDGPILEPAVRQESRRPVSELRDDDVSFNAIGAESSLESLSHAAAGWLRPALLAGQIVSLDPQASFLSAFLLARIGGGAWRESIIAIMLAGLEDNDVSDDAVLAVQAIVWLGEPSLPKLRSWLHQVDHQSEALLRHAISYIAEPDDADAIRLSHASLRSLDIDFEPVGRVESGQIRLPQFWSTGPCVAYRASLHELPLKLE